VEPNGTGAWVGNELAILLGLTSGGVDDCIGEWCRWVACVFGCEEHSC
jgi:hypothetical protein